MHTTLQNYLTQKLDTKHLLGLDTVLAQFEQRTVRALEDILIQGQICEHVYFVVSGALQVYAYDGGLNEKSRTIVCEHGWCTSIESFGAGCPASESIRALEPSVLLQIKKKDFSALLQDVPHFAQMYQRILEANYTESTRRLTHLMVMDAHSRVQWLQTNKPDWLHRFSGKVMASYLGMSPETYSRLKGVHTSF